MAQLRIQAVDVTPEAAERHLSKKDRKRLARNGEIVISAPADKKRRTRMRLELDARFAS